MTTTLDPAAGYAIVINTFAVEPERADALEAWIRSATEQTMRHLPGFVSANIHISLDRCRVVNYAQWRSRSDLEAVREHPEAQAHLQKAKTIAKSFDSTHYELRQSLYAEKA